MPARSAGRSPSPAAKKSLFSRIKAPFGPKARHISDFYVQPDDPHRQYGPGDVITGSVVLKVVKPFSVTHIVVCLHGYAQVYKTPNSPGEGYRMYNATLAAGKTKKSGGYYGNGFVSLFEDEIVLCGEGRLGEGTYQFNYELGFPKDHMPSSIDFERGTVTYMITSTMTRPTTISPTTTCDRKINFVEDIDIAPLTVPKPRIISLEPIPRRARTKRAKKSTDKQPTTTDEGQSVDSSGVPSRVLEINGSQADSEPPQSPVPSDVSFDSCLSSGGTGSANDSAAPSARTGESRHTSATRTHTHRSRRPITASVEIQKAGFLRGDTIPIKIGVTHTKQIKSLQGVIVTFYRQARVDMHPALPLVKGGDDDVYPKSRTGLSGLSLSSAGSTHLFRKDLSQSFASLIINPETLTAEIKATVRVPEEAFPSIASVPGAMISFKYYVEVVLDLQGKLSGLDRFLPNSGVSAMSAASAIAPGRPPDANGTIFAAWGGHFINTEEIRRDKSVVSCLFEVVVGTRDSERKSVWKQWPLTPEYDVNDFASQRDQGHSGGIANNESQYYGSHAGGHYHDYGHEVMSNDMQHPEYHNVPYYQQPPEEQPPLIARFALPDFEEEEQQLPEKERLRRAEARLLPSQPPENGVESSASAGAHAPSAPVLPDPRLHEPSALSEGDVLPVGPSAPPLSAFPSGPPEEIDGPSAPAYHHHAPPPTAPPITDDKQEMQRRRLENERSAPGDIPENEDGPSAPPAVLAPSAPVLNEEDEFGFNFAASTQGPLPKYER